MNTPAALSIAYLPLADLVPYAQNARRHSPSQIDKIKSSLVEFGWANPMLVADQQMIAGHARLEAALALIAEGKPIPRTPDQALAPTIDLSHLSPTQRRAYVLADNKLAEEAVWDLDLLRLELTDIATSEFDLQLAGFGLGEVDTILNGWSADFNEIHKTEAGLTELLAYVRVRCARAQVVAVEAAIRAAVAEFAEVAIEVAR